MAEVTPPRPLAEDDDRSQFDCRRESLNTWFHRHAWANHASGASRTNVICDATSGMIVGYVMKAPHRSMQTSSAGRDGRMGSAGANKRMRWEEVE